MRTKPEILVLWRGFFPSSQEGFISGPTSPIAYEIFRRLASKGFKMTIICWHFSYEPHLETAGGIKIIRVKEPICKLLWEKVLGLKISVRALYEMMRRKISLLHIMGEPVWHGWSLFIAKLLRIPVLVSFLDAWYSMHIYEEETRGKGKNKTASFYLYLYRIIIPFLEKLYARCANMVTVVTKDLKNYYISHGIPESKVFVITNAASIPDIVEEKVLRLRNLYGLGESDTVIGYLGGVRKIHGVEVLLESFIFLAEKYQHMKLIYIGDGDDIGLLKSRIPEKLKDRVIFAGKVSYGEVPNYLSLIDCGFISWENNLAMSCGSPLKVFEYMAAKKPVIGGCTDHIKQIVKESGAGIFMKDRSTACAVEALTKFLNLSREDRIRFGENGYQYISNAHSWEIIANRYVEIYNGLIS